MRDVDSEPPLQDSVVSLKVGFDISGALSGKFVVVDWSDGTVERMTSSTLTHKYTKTDVYPVTVTSGMTLRRLNE